MEVDLFVMTLCGVIGLIIGMVFGMILMHESCDHEWELGREEIHYLDGYRLYICPKCLKSKRVNLQ